MDDGILTGKLTHRDLNPNVKCGHCGTSGVTTLKITHIILPNGIEPSARLIVFNDEETAINRIGIECGCYARFHRQIAYITANLRRRK